MLQLAPVLVILSTCCCLLLPCHGYPSGAPLEVCNEELRPGKPHGTVARSGNGGFVLDTDLPLSGSSGEGFQYQPGQNYTVSLVGTSRTFKGFVLQARQGELTDQSAPLVGSFVLQSEHQRYLLCDNQTSSVTHDNKKKKKFQRQDFMWTAPTETSNNNTMEIYYSVVHEKETYWFGLRGSENVVEGATEVTTTAQSTTQVTERPNDGELVFRIPSDCSAKDCTVLVRIFRNSDPSLLTFQLSGVARAWVAVGFSKTQNMPDTDVLACNRDPDHNTVEVIAATNIFYSNKPDQNQSSVSLLSSSYKDGRISCSFTRTVSGGAEDYPLDEEYYVLYGRSNNDPMPGLLVSHHTKGTPNPSISANQVNPYNDTGSPPADSFQDIKKYLVKAHGILMLLAWPLLASTGVYIAAFMRVALPEGKWFQAHRALMLGSLLVGATGFALAFVAQLNSSTPGLIRLGKGESKGTAHFVIGIAVMFLQILNPLISICRCEPGAENRWIFTWLHGYMIGLAAELLAYVNIGIGLAIFTYTYSDFGNNGAPIWLYLAYAAALALLIFLAHPLMNHFCKMRSKSWEQSQSSEKEHLRKEEEDEKEEGEEDALMGRKKMFERETWHLWVLFGVFLVLTIAVVIALGLLVAI